ncbi:RHS repeat domain-containing protein [Pseudodesulfovibrio sediminis]|uniref:Teneurin-like YD-shell domain-containing protein n=1 Tax=Pseudodesulfovibrio sediminis TaxID=2810563 RepID=A0ABM7P7B9_9BACT|nr:RHS repeat-associated core domain-containing protein [Pseudodesulfovibrio sediminis]BCS88877.1 hypothetical protein PSDVSF_21190 [Pseudodesulfovibrio sediminis]
MLYDDHMHDRYCAFTYNPDCDCYEREWIHYADGTFEPVRRVGALSKKWKTERANANWWAVRKPVEWRPWHEGFGFSWNHSLGEQGKPATWGDKSKAELAAGDAPYFIELKKAADRRVESRTERLDGRREQWRFVYDHAGRLTSVIADTGWCEDFEYDGRGRRKADYRMGRTPFMRVFSYTDDDRLLSVEQVQYAHDDRGFRSARIEGNTRTEYHYGPELCLQAVHMPSGHVIAYQHDEDNLRAQKLVNGSPLEAYDWLDRDRLGRFFDGETEYVFLYEGEARLPQAVTIGSALFQLGYDQVGSLKAVVAENGDMVKMTQYGPFGDILWDSNPGLRMPLGFAGGLYDPDTGFVRFGHHDYDPDTGRWIGPASCGERSGRADRLGCCLDDPVNLAARSCLLRSLCGAD